MLRTIALTLAGLAALMLNTDATADASGPDLASYYEWHMALAGGVAYGWAGQGAPRRMREGVAQVGVGKDRYFALHTDGTLVVWADAPQAATLLMRGVARFAAGHSGWFAIDHAGLLWHGSAANAEPPRRVATGVLGACIGDSADYYITHDGTLHAHGLAHRGQYGDGRLSATAGYVATASDAVAVKAHTGHAIHLRRDGTVMGTGGNRFGPLSSHGLGDKADRWGPIFTGARAIATGSRHSAAIRHDASLWVWGGEWGTQPRMLLDQVTAVAAGDTVTLARTADGALWQWDGAGAARRLALP